MDSLDTSRKDLKLREVKFTYYAPGINIKDQVGYFHRWGKQLNSEGEAYEVAIIEGEDGTIYMVDPARIRFVS